MSYGRRKGQQGPQQPSQTFGKIFGTRSSVTWGRPEKGLQEALRELESVWGGVRGFQGLQGLLAARQWAGQEEGRDRETGPGRSTEGKSEKRRKRAPRECGD